jgi:hypothetical protein
MSSKGQPTAPGGISAAALNVYESPSQVFANGLVERHSAARPKIIA